MPLPLHINLSREFHLTYRRLRYLLGFTLTICPYLLTTWGKIFFDKLIGSHLVVKFPTFYGIRSFIIAFTRARLLYLSWARSIHIPFPEHPSYYYPSIYTRGLPSGLCSSGFPTKTLYTLLLFPMPATCPPYLILLDLITRTIMGEQYR